MDSQLLDAARRAVAAAQAEGLDRPLRICAVAKLRDMVGRRDLRPLLDAVDWVLSRPPAADLPVGSVVATADVMYLRDDHPQVEWLRWRSTSGSWVEHGRVDEVLAGGATVLRVGIGTEAGR